MKHPNLLLLRRKCSAACTAARGVGNGLNMKPRYRDMNMREAWVTNRQVVLPYIEAHEKGHDVLQLVNQKLIDFHYAGELYYHAKEHGLQSAMLLRLQQP